MRVGKFSGAVGTFAHLTPELEEKICARLGLKAAAVSSQVIQRDRHAHYLATLAVIASTLDKIATEIRHLQRTEVREAEEFFSEKQKGSSAMPHKRNPVTCEQISGLARVVRSERAGRIRERRPVARARHLPLLGRARHPARLDHARRLPAEQDRQPDRDHVRLSRTHAGEPREHARPGLQRTASARPGRARRLAAKTPTAWCKPTPCAPGKRTSTSISWFSPTRKSPAKSRASKSNTPSTCKRQLKNVDKIFARVFGGTKQPRKKKITAKKKKKQSKK